MPTAAPRLLAGAMLLATAVLAQERTIQTSRADARLLPLPKEEGVFHFIVFGDRTSGPPEGIKVLAQAVDDTNLLGPDLVMTVGDLVQGYNRTDEWLPQMREFKATMDRLRMPWFPVAGNHDIYWRGAGRPPGEHEKDYEAHFGPLWYWFRHKNAGFVVLYSDEGDPKTGAKGFSKPEHTQMSKEQLTWLEASLGRMRELDHVFVFLHHPRWVAKTYPDSNWDDVHKLLVAAGNVRAVFAGHIHRLRYDGKKDGIEYFALATTGGDLTHDAPVGGWLHHMNLVTVRKAGITVATIPVGAVIDPRTMTPQRWAEMDALFAIRPEPTGAPLQIGADLAASGALTFAIANPTSRPIELTLHFDFPSSSGWTTLEDHQHARLAAGKKAEVTLDLARAAGGRIERFTVPTLAVAIDYLGEAARLSLPLRTFPIPARLAAIPDFVAGREGQLRVPGKSAGLVVDSATLGLPDGPFTVEGWLRARDLKGRRGFLNKAENSEFGLFVTDSKPAFIVHLDGKYASARTEAALSMREWHHLAGVFDGKEVRLYVDGNLAGRAAASGKRTPNQLPFVVGADVYNTGKPVDAVDGEVDEVRVSRVARYQGESFAPARRLEVDGDAIMLLHLDRAIGGFVPDATPRGCHGTLAGGAKIE